MLSNYRVRLGLDLFGTPGQLLGRIFLDDLLNCNARLYDPALGRKLLQAYLYYTHLIH